MPCGTKLAIACMMARPITLITESERQTEQVFFPSGVKKHKSMTKASIVLLPQGNRETRMKGSKAAARTGRRADGKEKGTGL